MEKNKLDKLFQDKFAGREFEFQNSYWEGAEAMIEAAEKGNRRRLLGWIFGTIGLLLVGAFSWFLFQNEALEQVAKTPEINVSNVEKYATDSILNEDDIIAKIENSGVSLPLNEKEIIKTEAEKAADFNKNNLTKSFEKTVKNKPENKVEKQSKVNFDNSSLNQNKVTTNSKSNNYKNVENAGLKSNLPKNTPFNSNLNNNDEEVVNILNENTTTETTPKSILKEEKTTANLSALNTDFALLKWQNTLNRSLPEVNIEKPVYPPKSHRWNLQATVGGSVIVSRNFNSTEANDTGISDIYAGLTFGYKITPKISLQSGLFYKVVQANFAETEVSRQVNYGFGKQDDIFTQKAHHLHFVEMPVLVGYHFKKAQFAFGLSAGKLIAARGQVTESASKLPWERTNAENGEFQALLLQARADGTEKPVFREEVGSEKGWLETDEFEPFQVNLIGRYQLSVSPKFNLGIGMEYRFNREYLKSGQGVHSPLSVQLFTTYRIVN